MILKRIRKVEYNDNGEYVLSTNEKMFYPVHFIDNEDWLCIDGEDYTLAKCAERHEEAMKQIMRRYEEVDVGIAATGKTSGNGYYVNIVIQGGTAAEK
jgi:hypothetical protein